MAQPSDTARIFVGCDPNDCDLEQMMVLDYSLHKHATIPFTIEWMRLSRDPASFWHADQKTGAGWVSEQWATPFTAFRWGIPARCDFEGRAFYTDADVFYLCDIAEIWHHPMEPGKAMLASGKGRHLRLGELMWDCAAARPLLPPIGELRADPQAHKKLKKFFETHAECIEPWPAAYSNLDGDGMPASDIKALHYSDMGSQFSHRYSLPRLAREGRTHWFDGEIREHYRTDLVELFDRYYHEALDTGHCLDDYRNPQPFGPFRKQSQQGYTGNSVTRHAHGWLGRLFSC